MTPTEERRNRTRTSAARHRGTEAVDRFDAGFTALGSLAYEGAKVSANVVDLGTGTTLVSIDDRIALPTASVGKLLLLIEVSARISADESAALELLEKPDASSVGGSGLWQRMRAPALPMVDLAALVGATSDNLATNALLARVGLDSVRARTESLALTRTALLDVVRDIRGPDDAPQLSVASTAELAWLLTALSRGQVVDVATSRRVLDWIGAGVDVSLVGSGFGLDPLEHSNVDHGILLINKTGSDTGVRAEAGLLTGPSGGVAYAAAVQFADTSLTTRLAVLDALRTFGLDLLEFVT